MDSICGLGYRSDFDVKSAKGCRRQNGVSVSTDLQTDVGC